MRHKKVTDLMGCLVVTLFYAASSHACQFDTDCNVGSQCVKQGSSLYGVCVGGLKPGNANDNRPVYNSMDLNRGSSNNISTGDARQRKDADGTYGDTCSFDVDCGPGGTCVKGSGIYGTCM